MSEDFPSKLVGTTDYDLFTPKPSQKIIFVEAREVNVVCTTSRTNPCRRITADKTP